MILNFISIILFVNRTDCCQFFAFRKLLLSKSWPMIFAKQEFIIFADNITILGGILSGPIAFLGFNFLMILLICFAVARGISNLFSDLSTLLFMLIILLWFSCFLIIDLTIDISRVLSFGFPSISRALLDVFSQYLHNEN